MQKYCDDEKYLCDTCESIFQFPLKFFNHCIFEHGHEEEKITFDCAICYRSFSEISQFKQHITQKLVQKQNESTNQEKYSEFSEPYLLLEDTNNFQDELEYCCELCGNSFSTQDFLKEHIQVIHDQKEKKMDSCDNKSFSNAEELKRHHHRIHEGNKD